jgi:hypothetical protein
MSLRSAALGASVATILAPVFENQITDFLSGMVREEVSREAWGQAAFYVIVAVFIIGLTMPIIWFVRYLWRQAFLRMSFLRKVVLGDRFVQGWWIDEVAGADVQTDKSRAAIKITFDVDGALKIFGVAYSDATKHTYTFSSDLVTYVGRDINFLYDVTGQDVPGGKAHGFGRYTFPVGVGEPASYQGFFIDASRPTPSNVLGKKISDKALIKKLTETDGFAISGDIRA